MECPKCGSRTNVIDSRYRDERQRQYRIHVCKGCNSKYITEEKIITETTKSYVYY